MARYEYTDQTSNKFWEIELEGSSVVTRYGRIGSDGQVTTKPFGDEASAQKEYDRLVKEKTRKGYELVSGKAAKPKAAKSATEAAKPKTTPAKTAAPTKKAVASGGTPLDRTLLKIIDRVKYGSKLAAWEAASKAFSALVLVGEARRALPIVDLLSTVEVTNRWVNNHVVSVAEVYDALGVALPKGVERARRDPKRDSMRKGDHGRHLAFARKAKKSKDKAAAAAWTLAEEALSRLNKTDEASQRKAFEALESLEWDDLSGVDDSWNNQYLLKDQHRALAAKFDPRGSFARQIKAYRSYVTDPEWLELETPDIARAVVGGALRETLPINPALIDEVLGAIRQRIEGWEEPPPKREGPFEWRRFLQDFSVALVDSGEVESEKEWYGTKGATAEELAALEKKLGAKLPPSYRAFLETSNGFGVQRDAAGKLLPAARVDWLRKKSPALVKGWTQPAESDPSEEEHRVYGEEQESFKFRYRYVGDALQISALGDDGVYLLNPKIQTKEGEWEGWWLSNSLPGANRYPSFQELMIAELDRLYGG